MSSVLTEIVLLGDPEDQLRIWMEQLGGKFSQADNKLVLTLPKNWIGKQQIGILWLVEKTGDASWRRGCVYDGRLRLYPRYECRSDHGIHYSQMAATLPKGGWMTRGRHYVRGVVYDRQQAIGHQQRRRFYGPHFENAALQTKRAIQDAYRWCEAHDIDLTDPLAHWEG